ncbi:MAG: hypothetical protein AAF636_10915 [Pseudomonadota bacterium]
MMRMGFLLTGVLGLAACGIDGEPTPPPDVSAGVTINSSGIYPSVGVGFDAGLVRVFLGL